MWIHRQKKGQYHETYQNSTTQIIELITMQLLFFKPQHSHPFVYVILKPYRKLIYILVKFGFKIIQSLPP